MNSNIGNQILTIGIPVRNEEENIPELKVSISDLIARLETKGINVEIIINDNGSTDRSLEMLRIWESNEKRLTVNKLEPPLTFQASILKMMKTAEGDAFVIYQSDMQDPIELIDNFVNQWQQGCSIVAGVIRDREESFLKKNVRKLFYRTLKLFSDGNFIVGFQDFYLISKNIYKTLATLPNEGLFLRGHISSRFGEVYTLEYRRKNRLKGKSNFKFPEKYGLALDGLLLFGTRFVRVLSTSSFLLFVISAFLILMIAIGYLFGIRVPMRGWASIYVGILALLSLLGLAIGIILEYLIRIYRAILLK
jgi:glycosyltransferase involved in cell wall biosynthesis